MDSAIVVNHGSDSASGWTLEFDLPNATITSDWNGTVARDGDHFTVTPAGWAATVPAGGSSQSYGFCASGSGDAALPTGMSVSVG